MNKRRMIAIIKKDIGSITSSAQMWLPMIIVPLVFIVVIPLAITLVARNTGIGDLNNSKQIEQYLLTIPLPELRNELAAFPELMQKAVYIFANYHFCAYVFDAAL